MKDNTPKQFVQGAICYELSRKRVKNINLRVRADGSVAVSAPLRCSQEQIRAFITSKEKWILAAQARAFAKPQDIVVCKITPQEALSLFTTVSDKIFPLFAGMLGGEKPILKVRDMKTRWGVCKPSARQIALNIRLAEKPADLIEYVVLHEYAHFLVPNHSPAFWAVVAQYIPDYKARRARLRA